jgi:hypothetical protein
MQSQSNHTDTVGRDPEKDEELADVLSAISVVSKRLAMKLTMLSLQEKEKGGKSDGQNERTLSTH